MSKPLVMEILDRSGVGYRVLKLQEPAYSVQDVVRLTGVKISEICKTMLLIDKTGEPVLAVIPGDRKMNMDKIEKIVGKKLRLAKPDEIERITGYKVGALPPFGHKTQLKTIVDKKLLEQPQLNFGTGIHDLGWR